LTYFTHPTVRLVAENLKMHYDAGDIWEYQTERSLEMSAFLAGNSNVVECKKAETAGGKEREDGLVLEKSPRLEL
jgi:hypothetical protein